MSPSSLLLLSEGNQDDEIEVLLLLLRVGSLVKGLRTVVFKLSYNNNNNILSEEQSVEVKDSGGVFVFDGPMAESGNNNNNNTIKIIINYYYHYYYYYYNR